MPPTLAVQAATINRRSV